MKNITAELAAIRSRLNEQDFQDDLGLSLGDIGSPITESDTVLYCDEWTRRRGKDLHEGEFLKDFSQAASELDMADIHAAMYERLPEFELRPKAEVKLRENYVRTMLGSNSILALREKTVASTWLTEASMPAMVEGYVQYVQKMKQMEKERKEAEEKGNPIPQGDQEIQNENAVLVAVSNASRSADKATEEAEAVASAFGLEDGEGASTDMDAIKRITKRAANSPALREIINQAGRFTELARSKQKRRICQGNDTVIGVRMSDDVPRLTPAELASLAHPVLRVDAIRRLAEKQMLCREHVGVERVGKGPIMVWVDESGSMGGPRISTAKGLALAMAWVARKQKRWCSLVGFSSARQLSKIVLPPGKWDEKALIKWCEHMFNGGTQVPFDEVENLFKETGAPRGKTDILLVTDGETCSSDDMLKRFTEWKKANQARLISLVIDCDGSTVGPYSDELHKMKALSTDQDGVVAAVSV